MDRVYQRTREEHKYRMMVNRCPCVIVEMMRLGVYISSYAKLITEWYHFTLHIM